MTTLTTSRTAIVTGAASGIGASFDDSKAAVVDTLAVVVP